MWTFSGSFALYVQFMKISSSNQGDFEEKIGHFMKEKLYMPKGDIIRTTKQENKMVDKCLPRCYCENIR